MNVHAGIDLGSTTTKAVLLDESEQVVGRGITNSRSNYDVASGVARAEALIDARFRLLGRELSQTSVLGDGEALAGFLRRLERAFRLEQYRAQLARLREHGLAEIARRGSDERARVEPVLTGIFDTMAADAQRLYLFGEAKKSDFFRDLAGSHYQKAAERVAKRDGASFETLMGVFDKTILVVENEPLETSFAGSLSRALGSALAQSGVGQADATREVERRARTAAETPIVERGVIGTGYGRARLPFPKECIRSEILCHGLGAHFLFPGTATVLDIGGQDTKAIQVDADGIVTSFQMNDRCAAGCGRYLGYIADEMNLGLQELGPLALESKATVRINSTCTVFAGAELRDRLMLGQKREDILAGLHRAIILRAMSLLARSGGIKEQFTFTGGVAKNPAAVKALEKLVVENYGTRTLNISPDSIYTGAIGAALFAWRDARKQREAA